MRCVGTPFVLLRCVHVVSCVSLSHTHLAPAGGRFEADSMPNAETPLLSDARAYLAVLQQLQQRDTQFVFGDTARAMNTDYADVLSHTLFQLRLLGIHAREPRLQSDSEMVQWQRIVPPEVEQTIRQWLETEYRMEACNIDEQAGTYDCMCGKTGLELRFARRSFKSHLVGCLQKRIAISNTRSLESMWGRTSSSAAAAALGAAEQPSGPKIDHHVVCKGMWFDNLSDGGGQDLRVQPLYACSEGGRDYYPIPGQSFVLAGSNGSTRVIFGTLRHRSCSGLAVDGDQRPLQNSMCTLCQSLCTLQAVRRRCQLATAVSTNPDPSTRLDLLMRNHPNVLLEKFRVMSRNYSRLKFNHTRSVQRQVDRVERARGSSQKGDLRRLMDDALWVEARGGWEDRKAMLSILTDFVHATKIDQQVCVSQATLCAPCPLMPPFRYVLTR
jgi:hypothetical protein